MSGACWLRVLLFVLLACGDWRVWRERLIPGCAVFFRARPRAESCCFSVFSCCCGFDARAFVPYYRGETREFSR